MSGPSKKKAKASGKGGRPRGLSKEDRLALEKDIMGIFDPDRPYKPLSCQPTGEQIGKMSWDRAAASGLVPTDDEVRRLLQGLERQTSSDAIVSKTKQALLKLGFPSEESSLTTDKFLQLLIPKVPKNGRRAFMVEALQKIFSIYGQLFQIGAPGWPPKNLASLLEIPTTAVDSVVADLAMKGTEDQTSFESAVKLAPFILSWHKIRSSPRMRGSLSRQTKCKAAGIPPEEAP